ncbi:MAG: nucleoside/nucleotide kinase family protein [Ideonella sp.]|nr:nucleoside/nucleotide kinase family protein [Ideonella sp.]
MLVPMPVPPPLEHPLSPNPALPEAALARLDALIAQAQTRGQRHLLGLAGAPGSGKSTLAAALHAARPHATQVVPMDGYHLANNVLAELGRSQRKGAPDTFDAAGFVALLQRLRRPGGEVVYAPEYRREIEEAVAGAIAIPPEVPVLIVEGNYLLLEDPPWAACRTLLHEAWYVDVDDALRTERLVARHRHFGRSEADARAWAAQTDEPNARRIAASQGRADGVLRLA